MKAKVDAFFPLLRRWNWHFLEKSRHEKESMMQAASGFILMDKKRKNPRSDDARNSTQNRWNHSHCQMEMLSHRSLVWNHNKNSKSDLHSPVSSIICSNSNSKLSGTCCDFRISCQHPRILQSPISMAQGFTESASFGAGAWPSWLRRVADAVAVDAS